jgi:hypothetical protein
MGTYPNDRASWSDPDPNSAASGARLNAYAAAFPEAGGQRRDADGGAIRRVPCVHGAARFTVEGRKLTVEYVDVDGRTHDRFTLTK